MTYDSFEQLLDMSMEELKVVPSAPTSPGSSKTPNKAEKPIPGLLTPGTSVDSGYVLKIDRENGSSKYICNIDYCIESIEDYTRLINTLYAAKEGDEVLINIYTYGGRVDIGCSIINAIKNTRAHVTTCAIGLCASIGAMIWAAGDERCVSDFATIMFHMPSGFLRGKTADTEEQSRIMQQYFETFMRSIAGDILTSEEIDQVITKRSDLFLPAETIQARLMNNVNKDPEK